MYKLLVVDDEPKIREVIREYAEFNGYDVDFDEAMRRLGQYKEEEAEQKAKYVG